MSGVAALIAAAGTGTRLGRGPKALLEVGGRTLLDLAVAALAPHVDEVVVAGVRDPDEISRILRSVRSQQDFREQ